MADSLAEEQKMLYLQMNANLDTLNTQLRDQKNKYYKELNNYAAAFQQAIAAVSAH
jgi:hypothetical protein